MIKTLSVSIEMSESQHKSANMAAEQQQFLRNMHDIILEKTSGVLLPIWYFIILMWIQLIGGKANHPSSYLTTPTTQPKKEAKKRGPKKKKEDEEEEPKRVMKEEEEEVKNEGEDVRNGMDFV